MRAPKGKKDAMTRFLENQKPSMKHTPEYILSESIKLKALKIERMMKDN